MTRNLIGNGFECDFCDIAAAPAQNETAAYLREALAVKPVAVQYNVISWGIDLAKMGDLPPLPDLASHAMLARAWSWHTEGSEQEAWRQAAEKLERRIITRLTQGWQSCSCCHGHRF